MLPHSLSIIIPVFNEEENIAKTIKEVYKFAENHDLVFEVIVVDDGSVDSTGRILETDFRELPNLHIVTHKNNQGFGAAVKSGIGLSKNDYVFIFDADGQYKIDDLQSFFPFIVKGEKIMIGARVRRKDAKIRQVLAFIYRWTVRIFFRIKCKDINSSFLVIDRPLLNSIYVSANDVIYCLELILRLEKNGHYIIELPINFYQRERGSSKVCRLNKVFSASHTFLYLFYREITGINARKGS